MKIDVDIIQRIKVSVIFLFQFYKVAMGTMLTLFVPQACITDDKVKICTLTENYNNNEIYHELTMYWNMLTFMLFIIF